VVAFEQSRRVTPVTLTIRRCRTVPCGPTRRARSLWVKGALGPLRLCSSTFVHANEPIPELSPSLHHFHDPFSHQQGHIEAKAVSIAALDPDFEIQKVGTASAHSPGRERLTARSPRPVACATSLRTGPQADSAHRSSSVAVGDLGSGGTARTLLRGRARTVAVPSYGSVAGRRGRCDRLLRRRITDSRFSTFWALRMDQWPPPPSRVIPGQRW
jgi:hypothetical protein